jgi:hypothetical protein
MPEKDEGIITEAIWTGKKKKYIIYRINHMKEERFSRVSPLLLYRPKVWRTMI